MVNLYILIPMHQQIRHDTNQTRDIRIDNFFPSPPPPPTHTQTQYKIKRVRVDLYSLITYDLTQLESDMRTRVATPNCRNH
jgi:hypothetical protein